MPGIVVHTLTLFICGDEVLVAEGMRLMCERRRSGWA